MKETERVTLALVLSSRGNRISLKYRQGSCKRQDMSYSTLDQSSIDFEVLDRAAKNTKACFPGASG